jgi:OOP family OmpA-OmpF porin
MLKKILLLAMATALMCPISAMASMYVGASIGNSWQSATVDADEVLDEASEISENSTGWKIFGGFQSESFFGLEGGYRDLGKIKSSISNVEFSTKTTGWDVEALGHLELSIFDLFAKAGAFFWSTDSAVSNLSGDESGTSFLWGLGAGITLGPIGIRLEWESMEVKSLDNLSLLSLGATFGF